jgi:hypothetical protein
VKAWISGVKKGDFSKNGGKKGKIVILKAVFLALKTKKRTAERSAVLCKLWLAF